MSSSTTRVDEARAFLRLIFGPSLPDGCCIEVRTRRPDAQAVRRLWLSRPDEVNPLDFGVHENVWFGAVLRRVGTSTGREDDLTFATVVWADFDGLDEAGKADTIRRLSAFVHPPTCVVDSGGGLHAYWRLSRAVDVREQAPALYIREVVYGLASILGADRSVHDLPRMMRLPGTYNPGSGGKKRYDPPRLVRVLYSDPGRVYSVEELSRHRRPINFPVSKHVPDDLPPPVELRISPRLRSLVREGWSPNCGYTSRSELDIAVMVAMIRAGHSDEEIMATFLDPANAIGEKYREKGKDGDRYLQRTLASAHQWVNETASGVYGIRERDGHLEVQRGGEWRVVLNRPIRAIARLVGDDSGYQVAIETPRGAELRVLRAVDFSSNPSFKKAMGLAGAWTGTDRDVQLVMAYLESQSPPTVRSARALGWHGRVVVFPNAQLHVDDGTIHEAGSDYVYTGSLPNAQLVDCHDWPSLCRSIFEHLPRLHSDSRVVPIIGWFMASFVAPQVRALHPDRAFPLLMVYGGPEAGKTTILELLSRMCGLPGGIHPAPFITQFGMLERISSSNTLPVVFDEHRRTEFAHRHHFYSTLRSAYQEEVIARGRQDLSVARYRLTAPVCVAGEAPFRDDALIDRTVHVRLEKTTRNPEALEKLLALPIHEFNAGMYRHVARLDIPALWRRAQSLVPASVIPASSFRQRHAWGVVALGLLLMEEFWPGVHEEIQNLGLSYVNGRPSIGAGSSSALAEAIRIIAELIRSGRLREGREFTIRQEKDRHLLWLILPVVLPAVEEFAARVGTELPMDREAIRERMREDSRSDGPRLVVEYNKTVWWTHRKGAVRAVAIDLEQVAEQLEIPVDYWITLASGGGALP